LNAPRAAPSLELDVPKPPPKPVAPRQKQVEEPLKLELAVDISSMHSTPPPPTRVSSAPGPVSSGAYARPGAVAAAAPVRRASGGHALAIPRRSGAPAAPVDDDDTAEAEALAAYGEPPAVALLAPLYAYRVYQRQRELRKALAARREEAEQAKTTVEDALIATATRLRPRAAAADAYRAQLADAAVAEELLRSRDGALAKEQDAHAARLAEIDGRITKLEHELAAAQAEERRVATEVAGVEAALGRAESKLKRAEAELKALATPKGAG
jgi:hypothetical protein